MTDEKDDRPAWQKHRWTVEEIQFCAEYLRTGSAHRAHRFAFPKLYQGSRRKTGMTATFSATALLNKPHVQEWLHECRSEMVQRMVLTKENVLTELAKLAYSNIADFVVIQADGTPEVDLSGLTAEQSAAISELTVDTYMDGGQEGREVRRVKVKLAPKIAALELIGKHLKLFTDVIEDARFDDVAQSIIEKRKELARLNSERTEATKDDHNEVE